jgi:hypothetical protein
MKSIQNHWQEGYLARHGWNPLNATEYWSGMDSEENYKKNPHPDYTETSITYTYNSQGFRTHQVDLANTDNTILCFGCSHTEGVAVQTPWPEIIQQRLPTYKVYNYGHGGGSSDTVARLITNYVPLLRPKIVLILWPDMYRYELYDQYGIDSISSWSNDKSALRLLTDHNVTNWTAKNKIYVNNFSKIYNFNLYQDLTNNWIDEPMDVGRDFAHPGPKTHIAIAEKFLSQISC